MGKQEYTGNIDVIKRVDDAERYGELYRQAFLYIDPTLKGLKSTDRVIFFDVGAGAEIVAAKGLGKPHISINNDSSPIYQSTRAYQLEQAALDQIIATHTTSDFYYSSLGVGDYLDIVPELQPRLMTFLKIAPRYFPETSGSNSNQDVFFQKFVNSHKHLEPNSIIILSSLGDKSTSESIFIKLAQKLEQENASFDLYIGENVPDELRSLGEQILVIRGGSSN